MLVFLTGGTGFVGAHVLRRLVADGHSVRALARNPEKAKSEAGLAQWVRGDVVDGSGLDDGLRGCDAVVHLVGIIAEVGKATFEGVHQVGAKNVAEAAHRQKIGRFVHMSALGVRPDGVSEYQTSKWRGEEAVRRSGIDFCILRPSLIFGAGGFVAQMLDLMRKALLLRPVPGNGKPLFRPVSAEDVAACFSLALANPAATNQTVDLGGADELTLNEILAEIAACGRVRKPALHIPMPFMLLGAALAQTILPRPPVTVGQLRMLEEGSTCDIGPMKRIFGIEPEGFHAGIRKRLNHAG